MGRAPSGNAFRPADLAAIHRTMAALPRRQREVLEGIVAGKLNKTMAFELGISVRTIEGYRARLMSKCNAHSAGELLRMSGVSPPAEAGRTLPT